MIDWVSLILPVPVKVSGGRVLRITPDGEVESVKNTPYVLHGSFESAVQVCNIPAERSLRGRGLDCGLHDTFVYISGNPSKFLQGHNCFGSNDLLTLVSQWLKKVAYELGLPSPWPDMFAWKGRQGDFEITRLDVAESFRVGLTNSEVSSWLYEAHNTARMSHKNASALKGDTFYFGKNSRRHTVKLYNKYQEVLDRGIDRKLFEYREKMLSSVEGLLRIECCYRGPKLRDMGINKGWDLSLRALEQGKRVEDIIMEIYKADIGKIQISAQVDTSAITIENVGAGAYGAYRLWLEGVNVLDQVKKTTFYRYRNKLLPYDVDLLVPPFERKSQTTVLRRIVISEAVQVQAPSWFRENNLLAV